VTSVTSRIGRWTDQRARQTLCIDGDCHAPRDRECLAVPDDECTGEGSERRVCGGLCYGGPGLAPGFEELVVCRFIEE
jgi:hypothetical protein